MHLYGTMRINAKGHLEIGGCDTVDLARRFGTPLYVLDEVAIRDRASQYREAFSQLDPPGIVAYAGKAFLTTAMCRIIEEEGLSLDVVSGGELYTALAAEFPPEKIYFHGNNKSREELEMALEAGVHRIVVDNFSEIRLLAAITEKQRRPAEILLRITPGVEAHTHEYIQTGQLDSKFGFSLAGGQALEAVKAVLAQPLLRLHGFHCHIGSQIFALTSYRVAVNLMLDFIKEIKEKIGYLAQELDLGGGLGIRYNRHDPKVSINQYAALIGKAVSEGCRERNLPLPRIIVEPGRSIVGEAGTTLYTVGSSKEVPGIRRYIAVDGGMADNPRVALYQAVYEGVVANKCHLSAREVVSVAGRCCESGDMLIWDAELAPVEEGDILAVFCTGAYNYTMSSNYNRLPRPAVVLVKDGEAHVIVRRETYEDLLRNDVIPAHLLPKTKREKISAG